jgi:hypothetical protein
VGGREGRGAGGRRYRVGLGGGGGGGGGGREEGNKMKVLAGRERAAWREVQAGPDFEWAEMSWTYEKHDWALIPTPPRIHTFIRSKICHSRTLLLLKR